MTFCCVIVYPTYLINQVRWEKLTCPYLPSARRLNNAVGKVVSALQADSHYQRLPAVKINDDLSFLTTLCPM